MRKREHGMGNELINNLYNQHYESPELFPERDILNSLPSERLRGFINHCGEKRAEIDRLEQMACEVYEERFGEL